MNSLARSFLLVAVSALTACGVSQPPREAAPARKTSQGLINGCYPAADTAPYCDIGDRTCGGTFSDPLCCYDDTWGAKCHVDPYGNAVICEFLEVRCGVSCAQDLASCDDPVLDGQCNLLFANPGLCWGNCYDKNTQYCDGNVVCDLGKDCSSTQPTCPSGQQVCGDQCYSPATQSCLQGHVCGLEQSLCGDTCFTPGGNLRCYGGVLCNKNLYNGSCGGVCYNSATQNCVGSTLCAKPNDSVCNGVCYQASATKACCFEVGTYNPATQSCCDGKIWSGEKVYECGDCITPGSKGLGGSCTTDSECSVGKCSNLACGLGGECVCKSDADCGDGMWCDTGVVAGIGKNSCKALKSEGQTCSRGGQCESNCCKLHLLTNPVSPVCRPTDKCN